jgi:hypothetical protein
VARCGGEVLGSGDSISLWDPSISVHARIANQTPTIHLNTPNVRVLKAAVPECRMRVPLLRSIARAIYPGEESIPSDVADMRGRSSVGEPVVLGLIHRTFP